MLRFDTDVYMNNIQKLFLIGVKEK